MFDTLGFFENKHRLAECDKLKKLEDSIKPKRKIKLTSDKSYDIKTETASPLPLKPSKLSDTPTELRKKHKRHRRHKSKHKEKLQKSEEDSILNDVLTLMDLCGFLCEKDNSSNKKTTRKGKVKSRNEKSFHAPPQVMQMTITNGNDSISQSNIFNANESATNCSQQPGQPFIMVPIEKKSQIEHIAEYGKEPLKSVSKPALRRSQDDDIKQYWIGKNACYWMSQTSIKSEVDNKFSKFPHETYYSLQKEGSSVGLIKDLGQTDSFQRSASTPSACDISDVLYGDEDVSRNAQNEEIPAKCKSPAVLSSKYFPPLEIVPCGISGRECCPPACPCPCKDPDRPLTRRSLRSRQSLASRQSVLSRSSYNPMMLCSNKDLSGSVRKIRMEKSRQGFPIVQPVLGYCNSGKCSSNLKAIKYAVVKISEFQDFSTYEIMTPHSHKPRNMPTCISEIFVVSSQQRIMMGRSMSRNDSFQTTCGGCKNIVERDNEMGPSYSQGACGSIHQPTKISFGDTISSTEPLSRGKSASVARYEESAIMQPSTSQYGQPSQLQSVGIVSQGQNLFMEPRTQSSVGYGQPSMHSGEVIREYSGQPIIMESSQMRPMNGQSVIIESSPMRQPSVQNRQMNVESMIVTPSQMRQPSVRNAQMMQNNQVIQPVIIVEPSHVKQPSVQNRQMRKVYNEQPILIRSDPQDLVAHRDSSVQRGISTNQSSYARSAMLTPTNQQDMMTVVKDPSMQGNINESTRDQDIVIVRRDPSKQRSINQIDQQEMVMVSRDPSLHRGATQSKMSRNKSAAGRQTNSQSVKNKKRNTSASSQQVFYSLRG